MAQGDIRVLQEQADGSFKEVVLPAIPDLASPGPIGGTTRGSGSFTQLSANSSFDLADGSTNNLAFRFSADTDTGFFRRGNNTLTFVSNGANVAEVNVSSFRLAIGTTFSWVFNDLSGSPDLSLVRDAAATLGQRNGTNAQKFNIYNTFTSATNHERGFLRWSSNVFQIGTEKGSGGGTARALNIQTDGVTRITVAAGGDLTFHNFAAFSNNVTIQTGRRLVANQINLDSTTTALLALGNDSVIRWNSTASFPSLRRSGTTLRVRLADDSDFAPIQGRLTTHTNAVTETITATHTLTLFDAAGTAYKVPCVAA